MKNEGDKHHYLPVFYLKSWTGADGRLCEFSRPYTLKPGQVMPAKGAGETAQDAPGWHGLRSGA